MAEEPVTLTKRGNIAIITINRPQKANALPMSGYFRMAELMNETAEMPDITITVLAAKGKFFSA